MAEALAQPIPEVQTDSETPALRRLLDPLVKYLSAAGAGSMIILLLVLAAVLMLGAFPAILKFGPKFFISTEWDPVEMHFGALPMIFGTFVSSLLALLFAVPISLGAALFLTRLAPRWLVKPVSFLIELLAAIPSITYGFWGVAVLIPFLQGTLQPFLKATMGQLPLIGFLFSGASYGFSMLAAGIVLAIMITPIITAVAHDVFLAVPREITEGAYGLGATWWQTCCVVMNYAKTGIFGAVVLGFARAIGETMAVTMVIGNRNMVDFSLLAPGQTMASLLANEFLEADKPEYSQALIFIAFALLLITLLLNGFARFLVMRSMKGTAIVDDKPNVVSSPELDAKKKQLDDSAAAKSLHVKHEIRHENRTARIFDKLMRSFCIGSSSLAIGILSLVLAYVFWKGGSSLNLDLFTKLPGPPGTPTGMRNAIVGTLILVALASVMGIPLGVLCGVYLSEHCKTSWIGNLVRVVIDVLAGTPSIIVGVLIYELAVVPHGRIPGLGLGFSGYAGAMALAFIMCPIIARTTEEMLRLVPHHLREASLGLGGAHYQTLLFVVLPAASRGIITGIMLALARVAGETAPLLFTALGNDGAVYDPSKPFPALPLKIFQYATSPEADWIRQAWAAMLVLVVLILMLSVAMRFVVREKSARAG